MDKNNIVTIALLGGAAVIAYMFLKNKNVTPMNTSTTNDAIPVAASSTVTPSVVTQSQPITIREIYHDAPYIIPPVVTPVVVVPNVTNTTTSTYAPSYIYAPTSSTTMVSQPSVPMGTGSNDGFTAGMHFQPISSPTAKKYGAVF